MAKTVSPGVQALRKVVEDVYADARKAKAEGKLVGWSSSKFPCELAEAFDLNVMYPENQAAGIAANRDGEIMCKAAEDLGFVGEITSVNTAVINDAVEKGYIPVISTIAGGYHGETYNVNADVAAASIAAKLGAMKLILMTDVKGLLRDKDDEGTLIPVVNVSEVPMLKKEGIISGGMIPKIDCCVDAVRQGVGRAHIIDGRISHSILIELFSDEGIGTMFY